MFYLVGRRRKRRRQRADDETTPSPKKKGGRKPKAVAAAELNLPNTEAANGVATTECTAAAADVVPTPTKKRRGPN